MENPSFPVKPTVVPQARKYTREFSAASGKVFTEEDTITIEIPPIKNTYLTKDARVHFKFNLSFQDHNFTQATLNYPNYWNYTTDNIVNIQRKPVPMLESCGPYAFFRDLEVYDYLGNTLLEKVNRHDLLAAIMADFGFDSEVDRLRPPIPEMQGTQTVAMFSGTNTPTALNDVFSLPAVQSRVNGINLLDPMLNDRIATDPSRNGSYYEYIVKNPTVPATVVKVPTWEFSINLLSFLGYGSDHFVPLHNGYRIVLKTNPMFTALQFGLPSGGLDVPNSGGITIRLQPQVSEYSFFDVKLRAELLEVSPDLDSQIDKTFRVRMNSYNVVGRCDTPTIIPGNFLSATKLKIGIRQAPIAGKPYSLVGFRSRTYITKARLLYNDAVQQQYDSVAQMRTALGPHFDPTINAYSFATDQPGFDNWGTGGYLYCYPSQLLRGALSQTTTPADQQWALRSNANTFYSRFNDQAGKFLVVFDLSLNGYNPNTITGIDTTKTTLKLDFDRDFIQSEPFDTDVFIEHDAVITIKPGEYSTVSF